MPIPNSLYGQQHALMCGALPMAFPMRNSWFCYSFGRWLQSGPREEVRVSPQFAEIDKLHSKDFRRRGQQEIVATSDDFSGDRV